MDADEVKRLRTTSHAAMLAERDPWPARAAAGDTAAAVALGKYFYHRQQRAAAERWYARAAAAQDPEACHDLAVLRQEEGRAAEAEELFTTAAEAGHPGAMNALGTMALRRGDRRPQACNWTGRAAAGGSPIAMKNTASCCSVKASRRKPASGLLPRWRLAVPACSSRSAIKCGRLACPFRNRRRELGLQLVRGTP